MYFDKIQLSLAYEQDTIKTKFYLREKYLLKLRKRWQNEREQRQESLLNTFITKYWKDESVIEFEEIGNQLFV